MKKLNKKNDINEFINYNKSNLDINFNIYDNEKNKKEILKI